MINQTLHNRYRVTAHVGKGAMGDVYRATDRQTRQEVALKAIASELALDQGMLERFRREGEALRQLRHRNIVGFVEMFAHQGQQIIVMEYVPGGDLHSLIRQGALPPARAREIALDLCDALISAHRLEIVHRDIKPENVLLTADGTPKLTDFGVARLVAAGTRLTGTGTQVGTPYYMSPEAWEGKPLDAQADVWSLGVVLYEMLTGHVPFGGDTAVAVMKKVFTEPLPDLKALRPDLPDGLVKIVRRALARDKADRYRTIRSMSVDLDECVVPAVHTAIKESVTQPAPPRGTPPPVAPSPRGTPPPAVPPLQGTPRPLSTEPLAASSAVPMRWLALGGVGALVVICLLAASGVGLWMVGQSWPTLPPITATPRASAVAPSATTEPKLLPTAAPPTEVAPTLAPPTAAPTAAPPTEPPPTPAPPTEPPSYMAEPDPAWQSYNEPHPILGDIRVRQAIAYCTNPLELIQSVYPFASAAEQEKLRQTAGPLAGDWAVYDGPEVVRYFNPKNPAAGQEKGQALLEEVGWKLVRDPAVRTNAKGDRLSLKLTTTTAAFRKTWSAVFVQQMARCGIEIVPNYVPATWWFGDDSGLARRDFELGAFAWVALTDPGGQTLYTCNQIPFPDNGWSGQNYNGWCNRAASDAITVAGASLDKAERIQQYRIFQIEFARDMVSLPLFHRAEVYAATSRLKNFNPSTTVPYTWNAHEWELTDGGQSLVLAMSQEPDTMYGRASSMYTQQLVAYLVQERSAAEYNFDYQARQLSRLPNLDNGLAQLAEVTVKDGDAVVDATGSAADADGKPITLRRGLRIRTADGQEIEYAGGSAKMKQMIVSYLWQPLRWSDGQLVVQADHELGYKIDCDPASGAVDYSACQSIQKVDFTGNYEYVVTYKPGYLNYAALAYAPFSIYPAHQVIESAGQYRGKTLSEAPASAWASLPEIAETPLGTGPYVLTRWQKGVRMELEANPNYWRGPLKIQKIIITFVPDSGSAAAQLITGQVNVTGFDTLGTDAQSLVDAQKAGKPLQVLVVPSATWEHIDMQLFLP